MRRIVFVSLALGLMAPLAGAQYIDCGIDGADCDTRVYGMGNAPDVFGYDAPNSIIRTKTTTVTGAAEEVCDGENAVTSNFLPLVYRGRLEIRENTTCEPNVGTRCPVEFPEERFASGDFNTNTIVLSLGPLGFLGASAGGWTSYQGSVGFRQLNGRCVDADGASVTTACITDADCDIDIRREQCDEGVCVQYIQANNPTQSDFDPFKVGGTARVSVQNCWDDAQCTGPGESCQATCALSGENCQSDADCSEAGDSCSTRIDWDGIGKCTDTAGDGSELCFSNGDCPANEECLDGFLRVNDKDSCICCTSSSGTACPALAGLPEYPALGCPAPTGLPIRRDAPDFIFDGNRDTRLEHEHIIVPGQREGLCFGNRQRGCGVIGDLKEGADQGKCTNGVGTGCVVGDGNNPPLPSPCDDIDFGGIAGDRCDFSDDGIRGSSAIEVRADGRANPGSCTGPIITIRAEPGKRCNIPRAFVPQGDPQPGCPLVNFGIEGRPDDDCNGIDDAAEGRCHPVGASSCTVDADCDSSPGAQDGICVNGGDLCEFLGENGANVFLDTNGDGVGDECQCGDFGDRTGTPITNDGFLGSLDISGMALCANGVIIGSECDTAFMDANGDIATTALDIGGVVQAVNGTISPQSLVCLGNFPITSN